MIPAVTPGAAPIIVNNLSPSLIALEKHLAGTSAEGFIDHLTRVLCGQDHEPFSQFSLDSMQACLLLFLLEYLSTKNGEYYDLILRLAPFYCEQLDSLDRGETSFLILPFEVVKALGCDPDLARKLLVERAHSFIAAQKEISQGSPRVLEAGKRTFLAMLEKLPAGCVETVAQSFAEWRKTTHATTEYVADTFTRLAEATRTQGAALVECYCKLESDEQLKAVLKVELVNIVGLLHKARATNDVNDDIAHIASILFGEEDGCSFAAFSSEDRQAFRDLLIFLWERTADEKYLELLYFTIPYLSHDPQHLKAQPYRPPLEHVVDALQVWISQNVVGPQQIKNVVMFYGELLSDNTHAYACSLLQALAQDSQDPNPLFEALCTLRGAGFKNFDDAEKSVFASLANNPNFRITKRFDALLETDILAITQAVLRLTASQVGTLLDKIDSLPDQTFQTRALLSISERIGRADVASCAIDELAKHSHLVAKLVLVCIETPEDFLLKTCKDAIRSPHFPDNVRKTILSAFLDPQLANFHFTFTPFFLTPSDEAEIQQFLEIATKDAIVSKSLVLACRTNELDPRLIDVFMHFLLQSDSAHYLHIAAKIASKRICLSALRTILQKAERIKETAHEQSQVEALEKTLEIIMSDTCLWQNDTACAEMDFRPTWHEHRGIVHNAPFDAASQELCTRFESLNISRTEGESKLAKILKLQKAKKKSSRR